MQGVRIANRSPCYLVRAVPRRFVRRPSEGAGRGAAAAVAGVACAAVAVSEAQRGHFLQLTLRRGRVDLPFARFSPDPRSRAIARLQRGRRSLQSLFPHPAVLRDELEQMEQVILIGHLTTHHDPPSSPTMSRRRNHDSPVTTSDFFQQHRSEADIERWRVTPKPNIAFRQLSYHGISRARAIACENRYSAKPWGP